MQFEGKGAGGLRGLAPWRSLRQRLMRAAFSALVPLGCIQLSSLIPVSSELLSARLPCTPVVYRHASIRTLMWLSPRCPLVFLILGVLLSQMRSVESQLPGSRLSAPPSQSPQPGAFAYLADACSC